MKIAVDERLYLLALAHTGVTSGLLHRLVNACQTPQRAWNVPEDLVKQLARKDGAEHFLWARSAIQPELLPALYAESGIDVVLWGDKDYPELLLQTSDPPLALFVRGNLSALTFKTLGVVGTRRVSPYGKRVTEVLIESLKPWHPSIVSGLAAGVDTCAHESALKHGLPTVAVMGTGPDVIYPRQNEKLVKAIVEAGGCVLTENPLNAPGSRHAFPRRNRIIAGLSHGVMVVEGNQKSGALITAQYALDENRQVLAVPGSIFSPGSLGPNQLLQQGAVLVQSAEEIANALNWLPLQLNMLSPQPDGKETLDERLAVLSPLERNLLEALAYEPTPLDLLKHNVPSLDISELNATLAMLELQGLVSSLPGGRYCRN